MTSINKTTQNVSAIALTDESVFGFRMGPSVSNDISKSFKTYKTESVTLYAAKRGCMDASAFASVVSPGDVEQQTLFAIDYAAFALHFAVPVKVAEDIIKNLERFPENSGASWEMKTDEYNKICRDFDTLPHKEDAFEQAEGVSEEAEEVDYVTPPPLVSRPQPQSGRATSTSAR